MSVSRLLVTVAADPPSRLDKALARDVPDSAALSRSRLARLIAEGAVVRGGVPVVDPNARVAAGDIFEISVPDPVESSIAPESIPLDVVFEDDELIVVNKAAGMVVHPAPGTPSGTLVNALLAHCGSDLSGVGGKRRPGIVHRIDKDTTGLLVIAKSDRAHHGLADQFENHSVERIYAAVCHGVPDSADPRLRGVRGVGFEAGGILRIATHLGRHRTDRQRQAVSFEGGRHAVTRVHAPRKFGIPPAAALLDCWLETGRTHQIRVHLAYVGHGLIGDPLYGRRRRLPAGSVGGSGVELAAKFPRQALHARSLGFIHPVKGGFHRFEAPVPDDMESLIEALSSSPRDT